jgi:hypothetical protein
MSNEKEPLSKAENKPECPNTPDAGPPVVGDPDRLTGSGRPQVRTEGQPVTPRPHEFDQPGSVSTGSVEPVPEENGGPPVIADPDE